MKLKNAIIRDTGGFSKGFADIEINNNLAVVKWDLYTEKYNAFIDGSTVELGDNLWVDLEEKS